MHPASSGWDHPLGHVDRGSPPGSAGSTPRRSCWTPRTRDHPRVCGEPPPRSGMLLFESGITPAAAGSTTDHPRVCGEHMFACGLVAHCLGSPRVAGSTGRSGARSRT
ncbi:hypothetical protein EV646_116161 [Kribbella antiqua]|uniref:Uncharacterized protein n=1 Tax=Kribbella antiqua TaxID=2512217 RepID=A0A4R2IBH5_9ACTN|nr:hypothetical protein EV646_116161 [Kribbella antiqua]